MCLDQNASHDVGICYNPTFGSTKGIKERYQLQTTSVVHNKKITIGQETEIMRITHCAH